MLTTTLSFFSSSPDTRSVAVGADGTVYAISWDTLHAITPGGFEKWTSKIGNLASVACLSGCLNSELFGKRALSG